jgi:hypothetical protein
MTDIILTAGTVITPIIVYILTGYYASNQKWCDRKVVVSIILGLVLGGYAIFAGELVSDSWVQVAFNSAPVIAGMYLIDRIIKGIAKRYEIGWLYVDEC